LNEDRQTSFRRWLIAGMIFLASVLNYVDRQALSLLAPTIQHDLHLTDQNYALILNLFLAAYTLAYVLSGWVIDRLGVRLGFALFLGWWSVANMLTVFARSMSALGASRFLLGLGEAGNWTAAPKAVSEWFRPSERGLAIGIYTLGATAGATLTPVIIVHLAVRYGWQSAFVVTGAGGLLWLLPWLWLYQKSPVEGGPRPVAAPVWRTIFSSGGVWLLMLARLLTDPVWYFFQFWFAKYLFDVRHVSQAGLTISWVVYSAAGAGALGGGWLSGILIGRRVSPPASRLRIMLGCAVLTPLSALIPGMAGLGSVLALAMVAAGAQMAWLINLTALVVDIMPRRVLATAFGVIAAGSAIGGMIMNWGVGYLLAHRSYTAAFYGLACVHPVAIALIWHLRRPRPTPATDLAKHLG